MGPTSYVDLGIKGKDGETLKLRSYQLGKQFSPALDAYMDQRLKDFRAGNFNQWYEAGKKSLWETALKRFWGRVVVALPYVVGCIFAFWLISFVIGWIVRGFAGVRSGKDFREAPEA